MNKIAINPVLSLRHIRLPNFTCLFFLCVFFQFTGKIYALKNDILPGGRAAFLANHAPFFEVNNYHFNVFEDIVKGTSLGTLSASDPDNDQLKYVIVAGNTNGTLSIDSATGLLTLVKQLNHHTQDSFILRVSATDPKGLSAETKVIVAVEKAASKSGVDSLLWGRAANQQYPVNESQGEVVNGMLYTFGGFDSQKPSFTPTSRAYVFNPVANKWAPIAPMPPMNGTGYGGVTHAGFTTDGTDIYFAGGYTSNTAGNGQKFGTKEVWKYVVAKNIYMRLPDLPLVVAAGQLEYLEGKLHHIGGTNAARTVDLPNHYVLNLDSLSAGWKMLAPLPNPRQHSGSVVYEEKIYYIGGQHGQDDKLVAQKEVDRYDPVTNTWKKMADLPVPEGTMGRGHICSATIVLGEYIIVVAGETVHNSGRTNIVSAYMPALNTWQNLTPLPQTRYSGVAANLGGVIYYTGGSKTNITYMGQGVNTVQQVESLTVWNADTDQPIKTLLSGDTIDIGKLASNNLNIVANINPHSA
ncbi:MAG: kelch repeat-containing protein, partial [Mucilaginibacter sp.]